MENIIRTKTKERNHENEIDEQITMLIILRLTHNPIYAQKREQEKKTMHIITSLQHKITPHQKLLGYRRLLQSLLDRTHIIERKIHGNLC